MKFDLRRPRQKYLWFAGLVLLGLFVLAIIWYLRPRPPRRPVEHRVTSNSPEAAIDDALISPDGKYIAYSEPTGLYLRVIATGELRPWALPNDFIARPDSWFPDGIHLLVTHLQGPRRTPGLWEISLVGESPRKLFDMASSGAVSPDGKRIAFRGEPEGNELWLADSDGSNPRKLASVEQIRVLSDSLDRRHCLVCRQPPDCVH